MLCTSSGHGRVHGEGSRGDTPDSESLPRPHRRRTFQPVDVEKKAKAMSRRRPFVVDWAVESFARLGEEVKNTMSHRSRALDGVRDWLKEEG